MKFNSTRNVNSNSYIRAGNLSGRQSAGLFNSIKDAAPDYFGIVKTQQDANSAKARQAMESTGLVGQKMQEARATRAKGKYRDDLQLEKTKRDANARFAGYLGALGKDFAGSIADKMLDKPERPKPVMYDYDKIEGMIRKNGSAVRDKWTEMGGEDGPGLVSIDENGNIVDPTGQLTSGISELQTSGAAQPSTPAGVPETTQPVAPAQAMSFTPVAATGTINPHIKSILPGESGGHGFYNAYNLGGSGPYSPIGSGDSSNNSPFGKPVTQLTLDEIHALHDSGGAHAMGGYQFTGAGGLREAQAGLQLPGSTVFTPPVQDALANEYGRQTVEAGRSLVGAWPSLADDPVLVEKIRRGYL